MDFNTPFYPGAGLSDGQKLRIMQSEMWPVIFGLHAEYGLYVCTTNIWAGSGEHQPSAVTMCDVQGWNTARIAHIYRTVRRKSSWQIVAGWITSHLTDSFEEAFASVKPRYVLSKLRDKKHRNAREWQATIQGLPTQAQRVMQQMVYCYSENRREELNQTNWALGMGEAQELLEVFFEARAKADVSQPALDALTTTWAKLESRRKFREGNREEIDSIFACQKWMVAYDQGCAAYIVGAVDMAKALPDVITRMRTGRGEVQEVALYLTPETITQPFRKYWGLDTLPEEIKAALMPRLVMAKMAMSKHDKFADPGRFLPMFDGYKMWPEAGVLAYCYNNRGNPVILIDK